MIQITLKALRVINNMTQEEIAQKTGVSEVTIRNIEGGKNLGNVEFWYQIQQIFNLSDEEAWKIATLNVKKRK